MHHVLRSQQFDTDMLGKIFTRTQEIMTAFGNKRGRENLRNFRDRILGAIFYEPSTRTRASFTYAAFHLGMDVFTTENAAEFSSAIKGETLEDSIEVLCRYYPNIIVLRHPDTGAAERAARVADKHGVHVINAGDGEGQHPTQALLDLFTIKHEVGRLEDLNVVIGGDLARGRTARSLAYLLAKYRGVNLIFVAQEDRQMKDDILEHLDEQGIGYERRDSIGDSLTQANVVYWTRTQKERGSVGKSLVITKSEVERMKQDAILLHPLPRVDEITKDVDETLQAKYFDQAGYGMFVRMALIETLLKGKT